MPIRKAKEKDLSRIAEIFELITFAVEQFGADHLWALEKNDRALAFYRRHGFVPTGKREFEEGTTEYIVELKKKELTVNQFVQNGNRHL